MKGIKSLVFICLTGTLSIHAWSQRGVEEDIAVLKKVADNILDEAAFKFKGRDDGKIYETTKAIPEGTRVGFASPYDGWHYTNGVLNLAMLNMGRFFEEDKYTDFAKKHVAFGFDNYKYFEKRYTGDVPHHHFPFGQLWTMEELDDCGAMGASVIEVYQLDKKKEYKKYIDDAARHITEGQDRFVDGTLARTFPHEMTLWADDLYMSVPFLVRMGQLTGDMKYFDDAIHQVEKFNEYLWYPEKELYYHCYYSDLERTGVAHWGRCNGWIILAQAHLLEFLPNDHPKKAVIRQNLEKQILGVAKFQNGDGLWHQLLDKPDSYPESSASAMFVYGVAKAVNEGWIDDRYGVIAVTGWEGLKNHMITEDGQMKDVCVGTGIRDDLVFYYTRPARINEKHGLGALLDAGLEVIKLKQSYQ